MVVTSQDWLYLCYFTSDLNQIKNYAFKTLITIYDLNVTFLSSISKNPSILLSSSSNTVIIFYCFLTHRISTTINVTTFIFSLANLQICSLYGIVYNWCIGAFYNSIWSSWRTTTKSRRWKLNRDWIFDWVFRQRPIAVISFYRFPGSNLQLLQDRTTKRTVTSNIIRSSEKIFEKMRLEYRILLTVSQHVSPSHGSEWQTICRNRLNFSN